MLNAFDIKYGSGASTVRKFVDLAKKFPDSRKYIKDPVMKDESGDGQPITSEEMVDPTRESKPELEPHQAIQPEPLMAQESIYQGEPELPDEWQGTNEEREQRRRQRLSGEASVYGKQKQMNLTGSQGSSILTS
tara:strand:+ start:135 stop:536 length:402 start_codon:yes stop_codon:yes gene_type:complete